jgi:hypothetical protein
VVRIREAPTGFAEVETLDDPDQHFDDTRWVDSDREGRGKDDARRRNWLYELDSASDVLAELGSLLSFQRPKHFSPESIVF